MIADQYPGLLTRSDEEKLQLASELLADVIGDASEKDPTLASLVESRLAEYQAHPERVTSWAEMKTRLLALQK